jgi:hypothetical protein
MKKLFLVLALLIISNVVMATTYVALTKTANVTCYTLNNTLTYSIYIGCTTSASINVWDTLPNCFYPTNVTCSDCWQLYSDLFYVSATAKNVAPANVTITVVGYFNFCGQGENCNWNYAMAQDISETSKCYYTAGTLLCECTAVQSKTVTPTITPTITTTITATITKTITQTLQVTSSVTRTITPTRTQTYGYPTNTPVNTKTNTPVYSPTATKTQSATFTITKTITPTRTVYAYPSSTPRNTGTFTRTGIATGTATRTITQTATGTATRTLIVSPTFTVTKTITPTKTITATNTPIHSPTVTATITVSPTAISTNTPSAYPNLCDMGYNYLGQVHITQCANDMPFKVTFTGSNISVSLTTTAGICDTTGYIGMVKVTRCATDDVFNFKIAPSFITPSSVTANEFVTIHANVSVEGLPADIYYSLTNTAVKTVALNETNITGFVPIITHFHKEQHDGEAWRAGKYFADIDYQTFEMYVPNGVTAHVRLQVTTSDGGLTLCAYSGAVFAGGTTCTAKNFYLPSTNTTGIRIYYGGTMTGTLTSIQGDTTLIGANSTSGASGRVGSVANVGDEDSYILGAGVYAVQINALSATVLAKILFEWYEE